MYQLTFDVKHKNDKKREECDCFVHDGHLLRKIELVFALAICEICAVSEYKYTVITIKF